VGVECSLLMHRRPIAPGDGLGVTKTVPSPGRPDDTTTDDRLGTYFNTIIYDEETVIHTMLQNVQSDARTRGLLVAVVVLCVAVGMVAVPAASAAAQPEPPHRVFGDVVDSAGEPVPDATVEFIDVQTGEELGNVTTDSQGYYDTEEINNIPEPEGENFTVSVQGAAGASEELTWESGSSDRVDFQADVREVDNIEVELNRTLLEVDESAEATITANYANGDSAEVTDSATITSGNTSVASVSDAIVTANSDGTATITAEFRGATDTVDVTVDEFELQSIELTLDNGTFLAQGDTSETEVVATFEGTQSGTTDTDTVTADATITSGDTSVATVSGTTVTAESLGTATITAEFSDGGITESDSVDLEVVDQVVDDLTIELDASTIEEDETTDATVTATFEDGSTSDVTSDAAISSGDTGVATVSGSTITGVGDGDVDITATLQGVSDSAALTVEGGGLGGGRGGGGGGGAADDDDDDDTAVDDEPVESVERAITDDLPDQAGVTLTFDQTVIESITFDNEDIEGDITAEQFDDITSDAPPLPGNYQAASSTIITVSEAAQGEPATVEAFVSAERLDELNLDPDELAVFRLPTGGDEWTQLDTQVDEVEGGFQVTFRTPGFSEYAIASLQDEETPTPTPVPPTDTPTPEPPTDTPTDTPEEPDEGISPVIVIVVALVLLVVVGAAAYAISQSDSTG
jgi:hypothetical protein